MAEIETRLRRWGNSFGIVVPREIVQGKNISEGEDVVITIEKKKTIRELFGSIKLKKNAQKIKDELRKEWSKW